MMAASSSSAVGTGGTGGRGGRRDTPAGIPRAGNTATDGFLLAPFARCVAGMVRDAGRMCA
jgi:hypothetical protein